jgi:phosphoglycolate phosphatase
MKSVVFDLDGTLADTSKDLIAAANSCFEKLGLTIMLDPINDASVAFRGGRAMLRLGLERANCLDESIIDEQYSFLLKHYEKNINVETFLYDGVCDALNELQKRGYLLGVCTNKPEFLAEKLLKSLGIREYFLALLGADTLSVRKPNPMHLWTTIDRMGGDRKKAILIGDTITDSDTAKNANLPCILVSFGPKGSEVKNMKASALLNTYFDLPDLIDTIL